MSSPLTRGALIAGGSALALFVFLFFNWFADGGVAADIARENIEAAEQLGIDSNSEDTGAYSPESGWSGLGWLQLILVISAIAGGLVFAVVTFTEAAVSTPVALAAIVTGVGLLAFVALLYAVIKPPGGDDIDRQFSLFLGLLATAGITVGGYLGMQEESAPPREPPSELPPSPPSAPPAPPGSFNPN